MGRPGVCGDPEVAAVLIGQGVAVVLCGADPGALADHVVALRGGRGRVAALIGDLGDPQVEAAAVAMAAELFGEEPVVVRSVSEAGQEMEGPPGSERT